MGTNYSKSSESEDGVIQKSIKYIFQRIKEITEKSEIDFLIKASFIEIYNEEIRDLLNMKTPTKNIILRENTGTFVISGVTEMPVADSDDGLNLIWSGSLNRKTASTYSNDMSSRSHAIFTLNIDKINRVTRQSTIFKLNFVDLAGSERLKKTGATGERFRESVSINSGLLSLSKVIMALATASKSNSVGNNSHIPYRESKLTRILKDSLGGNSITLMLACISPSILCSEETVNTLNYACFAKLIKIQPMANVIIDDYDEIINQLRLENEDLKIKLKQYDDSLLKAENYKLKGMIKILREKLDMKHISSNVNNVSNVNIVNILKRKPTDDINDEQESKLIANLLIQNEEDKMFEMNELNELNQLYDPNDNNLEIEYSDKIKENLKLKDENDFLFHEIENYRIKEQEYKNKLGHAANIIAEEDSREIALNLEEYYNSNKNKNIKRRSNHSILNTQENLEIEESESSVDINVDVNNKPNINTINSLKIKSNRSTTIRSSKAVVVNDPNVDKQVNMIHEKIKNLKQFQESLKKKIIENEVYKNKIVRNKNEEITFVKRDALEKSKQLKNLEKIHNRKSELLESSENTINTLKEQLRNKSQEIKKIKDSPHKLNQSTDNKIPKRTSSISRNDKSPYPSLSQSTNTLSEAKIRNNYINNVGVSHANRTISMSNFDSNPNNVGQDEPKEFYLTLKMLMRNIEELIVQKHKLEKKYKYLTKEKNDFLNLIKVNEERLQCKIKSLTKIRNKLDNILKAIDDSNKDKISYTHKFQATLNKINSINNRLDKMTQIQENTLNEIESNQTLIKSKIENVELRIQEIKDRISNNSMNHKVSNIVSPFHAELGEKDEKLVFIELDNIYKDKKILELEKTIKELTLKYEDKIFQLQFELKNIANSNSNLSSSCDHEKSITCLDEELIPNIKGVQDSGTANIKETQINRKEYDTYLKTNSTKKATPRKTPNKNMNILPPTIKKKSNDSTESGLNTGPLNLKSQIEELTSSSSTPRLNERIRENSFNSISKSSKK